MRQTSRAVALLLALDSANAVASITANVPAAITSGGGAYVTVFNPASNAAGAPTPSDQLNNRQAAYTGLPALFAKSATMKTTAGFTNGWTTIVAGTIRRSKIINVKDAATTLAASTIDTAGAGCVECIRGAGVWCSRTYSYLSITNAEQTTLTTVASNFSNALVSADADLIFGTTKDQGSCCDTDTSFNSFIGTKPVPVRPTGYTNNNSESTATGGVKMVAPACVAMANADAIVASSSSDNTHTFGKSQIENAANKWSSWWCSNGLYKKVTKLSTVEVNAQQTIVASQNKRLELALVGCPNPNTFCGYNKNGSAVVGSPVIATDVGTNSWTVSPLATGLTVGMKCTWVAWSVKSGPTFTLGEGAGPLGITATNWVIHAMEYTGDLVANVGNNSGSLTVGIGGGYQPATDALNTVTNLTPLFTMPGTSFATLRTWYGEGSVSGAIANDPLTGQSAAWMSPGQAPIALGNTVSTILGGVKSQLYGNVANVPVSSYISSTEAAASLGNFNYGKYNTNVVYDLRQVRYFPAKVAQTQYAAGQDALQKYNTALSAYKTAKTTWDNYVAILEKNAAQDAFAALFSPPKAPTVPPLPNKPWLPAAYSGYTRATQQQVVGWSQNTDTMSATVGASPLSSQIWTNLAAAQTVGGWGSFTATIFTYRKGWGKSFGTIGYSGDADKLKMGDVWNYKWSCAAATASGSAGAYPGVNADNQCAPTYASGSKGAAAASSAITGANAVKMITSVSLWSSVAKQDDESKQVWAGKNGLSIVFTGGAWKSSIVALTPMADPTAATDAKSLTGLAGAQALVASSAAALAVAAALY